MLKESEAYGQKEDDYIIPVEMAVGRPDRCDRVFVLADAGIPFIRMFKPPITEGTQICMLYMMKLDDAILFDEKQLDLETLTSEERSNTELRISTLKSVDPRTLKALWAVLGCQGDMKAWREYQEADMALVTH